MAKYMVEVEKRLTYRVLVEADDEADAELHALAVFDEGPVDLLVVGGGGLIDEEIDVIASGLWNTATGRYVDDENATL